MKLVIFGLTISSSWGNGHATIWRGLLKALIRRKHEIVFFERDVPYYSAHRDVQEIPGGELVFYQDWAQVVSTAERHLTDADVAMVTSYCPDGIAASELVLSSRAQVKSFYDLDTPVTLERLRAGEQLSYVGSRGFRDFDIVLSYTGGASLDALQAELGATHAVPIYGSVDPETHFPVPALESYRADLSYLGTYAKDRQAKLEQLFIEPARRLPQHRFVLGGAQYPVDFPWSENIFFVWHLPPAEHPAFFCSSRLTLNITRQAMADMGYCPSGRLFEAAACGTPILSDWWEGLDEFFEPGKEILVAHSTEEAVQALRLPVEELRRISEAARARTLAEHTAERRAIELEKALQSKGGDYVGNYSGRRGRKPNPAAGVF
jgi:spore maturation protein CgeB